MTFTLLWRMRHVTRVKLTLQWRTCDERDREGDGTSDPNEDDSTEAPTFDRCVIESSHSMDERRSLPRERRKSGGTGIVSGVDLIAEFEWLIVGRRVSMDRRETESHEGEYQVGPKVLNRSIKQRLLNDWSTELDLIMDGNCCPVDASATSVTMNGSWAMAI